MFEDVYKANFELEEKYWWFVARNRIVFELLQRFFSPDEDGYVLDFGCGTGGFAKILSQKYKVICLDPSPIAVKYCKNRGLELVFQSTIDDFYLQNPNLKAVCALDVIEHIDDDVGTLQKLYKLLENNGKLVVTVPAYQWLWSNHDVLHMHKRRYTKKHLLKVLSQSGFQVIYISYFNFFLFLPAIIKRLLTRRNNVEEQPPVDPVSDLANKILTKIFLFEKFFLPKVRFPFGLSIIAIARKNG